MLNVECWTKFDARRASVHGGTTRESRMALSLQGQNYFEANNENLPSVLVLNRSFIDAASQALDFFDEVQLPISF